MRNAIDAKKKEIQQLEIDEVMLNDFVATNFGDVDGLVWVPMVLLSFCPCSTCLVIVSILHVMPFILR